MAVNYAMVDGDVGYPPINVAGDTTKRIPIGTYAVGRDTSTGDYGNADFIYVKFTGTVAAGDLVKVDRYNLTCVDSPAAATKGVYGIAMGAQTNGCFGWVMVRGIHDAASVVSASGTVEFGLVYGSAITAGRVTNAVTANYIVDGVAIRVQGSGGNVGTVEVYWPYCSGR